MLPVCLLPILLQTSQNLYPPTGKKRSLLKGGHEKKTWLARETVVRQRYNIGQCQETNHSNPEEQELQPRVANRRKEPSIHYLSGLASYTMQDRLVGTNPSTRYTRLAIA